MRKKILLLGGNRFFGKRLAALLARDGHAVSLLNRGKLDDGLGPAVERIVCDRGIPEDLKRALGDRRWDLIFDQICYEARDAEAAIEILAPRTGHYVFTSTQSVYGPGADAREEDFRAEDHGFVATVPSQEDYPEAKRQCEAVFARGMPAALTVLRFPIVLGPDDYTGRLRFHVDRAKSGQPIFLPNPEAEISFVHAADAALALAHLGLSGLAGTFNVASPAPARLSWLMSEVEKAARRKLLYAGREESGNRSPFGLGSSWWMNTDRLRHTGFSPRPLTEWLPALVAAGSQ